MKLALSYDDVLLIPKKSNIKSRKDVSLKTKLTKKLSISNPIIAANMDTVCEAKMAIAMAKLGCVGIIHRFNTIDEQVAEVEKVKRYRNEVIENPLTILANKTLAEAKKLMEEKEVTSLLIVSEDNKLMGILTHRDFRFRPSDDTLVFELMTSRDKLVVASPDVDHEQARKLLMENKVEKLPLVDSENRLVGLITSKDLHKRTRYPHDTLDSKNRIMVGAAIGVKESAITRAEKLIEAGCDFLVIDIAHGHSDLVINTLKKLKDNFPDVQVIAGNVCTPEGTKELIDAGADAIKIGVGPGANCSTRIVTGCGYPQISAVMDCFKIAKEHSVPIIADGGIKNSGDAMKAVAAGADTIMVGSIISGTGESPGKIIMKDGHKYKVYRGMASKAAKNSKDQKDNKKEDDDYVPEGVEALIPFRGSVKEIIVQMIGGMKSGMSYCGAHTIEEAKGECNFVQITTAGMKESIPHNRFKY